MNFAVCCALTGVQYCSEIFERRVRNLIRWQFSHLSRLEFMFLTDIRDESKVYSPTLYCSKIVHGTKLVDLTVHPFPRFRAYGLLSL